MEKGLVKSIFSKALNPWGRKRDIISLLLEHSVPGALLDVAKRFEASKSDEDTLLSIRSQMENFVRQGDPSSPAAIYWLYGPAGVGKSAVAQSLALSLADERDLAASFFFSRTPSGQDDGDRLIVTLAYQLAMTFPGLRPFISESIKSATNLFTASNSVKMQRLVVDPINAWQDKLERSYLRRRAHTLLNPKRPHPRLILVDGLDACRDPLVQQDILLSIGRAVQQLKVPLRFVINSRPELLIMATFKFDPIFQGTHAINVAKLGLDNDEEAVEQTIDFFFNQFAWIRGTHRLGRRLPQSWPHPSQIAQLARTSLRVPTYSDTVTRHIAMPDNRPAESLEKILSLSDTVDDESPCGTLDALYQYIFTCIPDEHKSVVRDILHFLIAPSDGSAMDLSIRITPALLDKYFGYKRGHTLFILRATLSCIVQFDGPRDPIKVRHPPLSEFLLNPSRSGCLHIAMSDVLRAIAAISLFVSNDFASYGRSTPNLCFVDVPFLEGMVQAHIVPDSSGFRKVVGVEFSRPSVQQLLTVNSLENSTVYGYLVSAESVTARLVVLMMQRVKHSDIREIVSMIKAGISAQFASTPSIYLSYSEHRPAALQKFSQWASTEFARYTSVEHVFADAIHHYNGSSLDRDIYDEIFDLYFSMVAPLFDIFRESLDYDQVPMDLILPSPKVNYPIETLMEFLSYRHDWEYSHIEYLCLLAVDLLDVALRHESYSPSLIASLDRAADIITQGRYATRWLKRLAVVVTHYIARVSSDCTEQFHPTWQRVNETWAPYTEPLEVRLRRRYDSAMENGNQLYIASVKAELYRAGMSL